MRSAFDSCSAVSAPFETRISPIGRSGSLTPARPPATGAGMPGETGDGDAMPVRTTVRPRDHRHTCGELNWATTMGISPRVTRRWCAAAGSKASHKGRPKPAPMKLAAAFGLARGALGGALLNRRAMVGREHLEHLGTHVRFGQRER